MYPNYIPIPPPISCSPPPRLPASLSSSPLSPHEYPARTHITSHLRVFIDGWMYACLSVRFPLCRRTYAQRS